MPDVLGFLPLAVNTATWRAECRGEASEETRQLSGGRMVPGAKRETEEAGWAE